MLGESPIHLTLCSSTSHNSINSLIRTNFVASTKFSINFSSITSLNSNLYNSIISLIRTNFHVPLGKNSPLFEFLNQKAFLMKPMKPLHCRRCQRGQETLPWHPFDCFVLRFSQYGSKAITFGQIFKSGIRGTSGIREGSLNLSRINQKLF